MSDLHDRARAWMAADPDPDDRDTVARWLATDDPSLAEAFGPRLSFGTAGLRGPLRPGPAGMNRLQVRQVTAALAATLDRHGAPGPVVIGYDGRRGSRVFAEDAARVLRGAGRAVFRFTDVVPTPVVAWAVRALGAAGGIVVTASHNPPDDNGYKVFWADGAQIVAPVDAAIAAAIGVPVPWSEDAGDPVPAELIERYLAAALALRVRDAAPLRVVYTPMHGVGGALVTEALRRAGYTDVHVVASQFAPDGRFPTVRFPNPEEPGALDLAVALAEQVSADLIIANDPDADRLALAARGPSGWRRLTGDEVGWLLADELLSRSRAPSPRGVATTIVSSTRLAAIAAHHGVEHTRTLTGFKWLSRVSIDLHDRGGELVLGYEEALGYSIGGLVRDKDGVSAAVIAADLAAAARARGESLFDRLDDLDRRFGPLAGRQASLVLPGEAGRRQIAAAMAGLRDAPPGEVAGLPVDAFTDLLRGAQGLPTADLLAFDLRGGHRALVRPSGTEPKLKLYVEARGEAADLADARAGAADLAARIEADLLARVRALAVG